MNEIVFHEKAGLLEKLTRQYFEDVKTLIEMHTYLKTCKLNFLRLSLGTQYSTRSEYCVINSNNWDLVTRDLTYHYSQEIAKIFKKFSRDRQEEIRKQVEILCKDGDFEGMHGYLLTYVNNYKFYIRESFLDTLQSNRGSYKTNQKNLVEKLIFYRHAYMSDDTNRINYSAARFIENFNFLFGEVEVYDSFKTFKNGNTHLVLTKKASDIINSLLADETKIGR